MFSNSSSVISSTGRIICGRVMDPVRRLLGMSSSNASKAFLFLTSMYLWSSVFLFFLLLSGESARGPQNPRPGPGKQPVLRSGFLLEAAPGNVRLRGAWERTDLGPRTEGLPENEPRKLPNSDMSFASMALLYFIFKAHFFRKFMPLSSSESELEMVAEFSGGWGVPWLFFGCRPDATHWHWEIHATLRGLEDLPWLRVLQPLGCLWSRVCKNYQKQSF